MQLSLVYSSPGSRGSRHCHCGLLEVVSIISIIINIQISLAQARSHLDIERKSIVFDIKTPKVFYCPQEKPADLEKLIVKAQPLDKLCEFEGKPKPKGSKSDCYNDVDETEFACDEKRRFMIKLDLASEYDTTTQGIDDLEYILTKNSNKTKKKNGINKKY